MGCICPLAMLREIRAGLPCYDFIKYYFDHTWAVLCAVLVMALSEGCDFTEEDAKEIHWRI